MYNVNDVLNRHTNKPVNPVPTVSRKDIIILLPYLGLNSNLFTNRLKSCVDKFYPFVNLKVIFQNTRCINSSFPYKDHLSRFQLFKLSVRLVAGIAMNFTLAKQNKDCMDDRKTEHFNALVKRNLSSAIAEHVRATGHNIKWDHFDILGSGKSDLHCKIKETFSLLTN